MEEKKFVKLSFIIAMLFFMITFSVLSEEEQQVIYIINSTLGKDLVISEIALDNFLSKEFNQGSPGEFSPRLNINNDQWNSNLNGEPDYREFVLEGSDNLDEFTTGGKTFVLINTYSESNYYNSRGDREGCALTGFSIKGNSYELLLGPSNAFSWETEGWTEIDRHSSFFDSLDSTGTTAYISGDVSGIFMEIVTDSFGINNNRKDDDGNE